MFKRAVPDIAQKAHYIGNNLKSLHLSVEASLKKLQTSYIDILYLHWVSDPTLAMHFMMLTVLAQWDWETSMEEVMNGLHNLVVSGKVLYLVSESLQVSDTYH